MSIAQRITKNIGVLFISKVISSVLGFFFLMYTARYLGAEGFGVLSFALAFTAIFSVFTDFGLGQLTIREVAKDKSLAQKYLGNIIVIKMVLVVIAFGLIALIINLLNRPEEMINIVYLVALSVIFGAFTQMFDSIFLAFEKMEYQSAGQILNSVLMLSGALFAISQGFSVVGFAFLYFFVSVIILGYSFIVSVWKFAKPKIEVDLNFWKPTLKEALPFGLSWLFFNIYYNIDTVMLSTMKGDAPVGWYNAAYRLIFLLLFIRIMLQTSIFPVMCKFYETSKESLRIICEKLFKYSMIIAFPIAIGTTILAERFISLIYGNEYLPSIIALQILIWSFVILLASFMPRLFEAINRQTICMKISMVGVVINILLNLLLIPRFSYVGAAIATCLTLFILLLIQFRIFLKTEYKFSIPFILSNISKILIAGAVMGCFVRYFYNLNLIILIIFSALIYITLLYLMKALDIEDIGIIFNKK